jgi:uncharacterized protein
LLSFPQKQCLENKLIRYSDTTLTQIVLAVISSAELEKWRINQKGEGNGVLMLWVKDDKKIAI